LDIVHVLFNAQIGFYQVYNFYHKMVYADIKNRMELPDKPKNKKHQYKYKKQPEKNFKKSFNRAP